MSHVLEQKTWHRHNVLSVSECLLGVRALMSLWCVILSQLLLPAPQHPSTYVSGPRASIQKSLSFKHAHELSKWWIKSYRVALMGLSNNLWSPFCRCYLKTLLCQKYLRRIQCLLSCPIPGAAGEEGNPSFWYWGIFPHKRSVGLILFKAKFWNNLGLPWTKAGPGENRIIWETKVQKRIGKRWNVECGRRRHPFPLSSILYLYTGPCLFYQFASHYDLYWFGGTIGVSGCICTLVLRAVLRKEHACKSYGDCTFAASPYLSTGIPIRAGTGLLVFSPLTTSA